MGRPVVYRAAPARVEWLPAGRSLGEVLEWAAARPGELPVRVYLTGAAWPDVPGWLLDTPPGWAEAPRGHYLDTADPRGSYVHGASGRAVEVRRAAAWFGDDVTPAQAALLWGTLEDALREAFRAPTVPVLLATPAATGQQLLALSWPAEADGATLDDDTAALIRSTSPQHRMEVPGFCWDGCDAHRTRPAGPLDGLSYFDGRIMYAALLRELGTAPARRLTADQAEQLADAQPFARARYRVTFTIPQDWAHPGLLMCKHPDGEHWHTPDRPGYRGETWADAAEVWLARQEGWAVRPREGIALAEGRPLDLWRTRLLRALEHATRALVMGGHAAARHAIRAILIQTVGSWHSTGRLSTQTLRLPVSMRTCLV